MPNCTRPRPIGTGQGERSVGRLIASIEKVLTVRRNIEFVIRFCVISIVPFLMLTACGITSEDFQPEITRDSDALKLTYILGGPGSGYHDNDSDGLPDWLERYLAQDYQPYLIFDEDEPLVVQHYINGTIDEKMFDIYYQVTPLNSEVWKGYGGQQVWEVGQIGITYLLTYDKDYGTGGSVGQSFSAHNGDTEKLKIRLGYAYNVETNEMYTAPIAVVVKRHFDPEQFYAPEMFTWEPPYDLRRNPRIYVSKGKHAMYGSLSECKNYDSHTEDPWIGLDVTFEDFEHCGGDSERWHLEGLAENLSHFFSTNLLHNVGESSNHLDFPQFTHQFSSFPLWQNNHETGAYYFKRDFCGNHNSDCGAAPIWEKWEYEHSMFGSAVHIPKD